MNSYIYIVFVGAFCKHSSKIQKSDSFLSRFFYKNSIAILPYFQSTPQYLSSFIRSDFFRLETSFLAFLALLYYGMNQLFTHPFYTNRPRFV